MGGIIRRFNELTVVRGDENADAWIINSGRYQGLFGPGYSRIWQFMEDGTLRIGDVPAKKFVTSLKIETDAPDKLNVYSGAGRVWIVPYHDNNCDAIAIDLEKAEIVTRVEGLECSNGETGRVTADGSLIMQHIDRIEGVVYDRFRYVDVRTQETTSSLVKCVKPPETFSYIHFFTASPSGGWWLKLDHTHFPVVEYQATTNGNARKYYGLTVQVWSTFPVRFVRRIVVAWLKAEDLPDETGILKTDSLREVAKQSHAEKAQAPKPASPFARLFGRRGTSDRVVDPDERYRAILSASAPERDRIYTAISKGLHRPEAEPEADFPPREAFGEAAQDDAMWHAVTKNLEKLFRDSIRKVVGWEGEDIVWFDRLGHLICAGMDGSVSPQIWFERPGLQHLMRPFPNLPGELEVSYGRKLLAVNTPRPASLSRPEVDGGTLQVDGSPAEKRFEPVRISKITDGWKGPEAIPSRFLHEQSDIKLVEDYRQNRSNVRIPLHGSDPASRIAAIRAYRDLLDMTFFERANDSRIDVQFTTGNANTPESDFFLAFGRQDRDWAIAPLRELVTRYAELAKQHGRTVYQKDAKQGSLLAQAVRRLGELDEASLPAIIAYGQEIDGGHEYYFAGDTMPAILAAHGWTEPVTAFVAWTLAFNFYNTYDRASTIWQNIGLGNALKQGTAEEAADFVHSRLAPFIDAGRLDWQNFACLRGELGTAISDWESEFFTRLVALAGETAFELH
jgi:hypothetical protein